MLDILRRKAKLIFWITTLLVVPSFILLFGARGNISRTKRVSYAGILFGKKISLKEFGQAWWSCRNRAIMLFGQERLREMAPDDLALENQAWDRLILLREVKRQGITTTDEEVVRQIKRLFTDEGEFSPQKYSFFLRSRLRANPRAFEEQIREDINIAKLAAKVMSEITVTEAQLEKEYRREFEQAEADYILVETENFLPEVRIDADEVESYYQQHLEDFRLPEQVNVEYIAINYSDLEEEVVVSEEDIEEYYQTHPEEFKKSAPVEGEEAGQPPGESRLPLEEVKEHIRQQLVAEKVRRLAEERVEKIADRLVDIPDLEEAAEGDYPVKETGFFGRNDPIPSVGWSYGFTQTAFRLKAGETSDIIRNGRGCYLLRVKEKRPSAIPELGKIKELVEETLRQEKAKTLALAKAQEYRRALQEKPDNFGETVKELGLELKQTQPFTRSTYLPGIGESPEFVRTAFFLEEGGLSEAIPVSNGYAVLRVGKFLPADMEKFVQEKDAYRQQTLTRLRQEHYQHWFAALKQRADLKINPALGKQEES